MKTKSLSFSIDNHCEDEIQLLCPMCKTQYTHLDKIEKYREKDGRLCVKLHFYCEEGHPFTIDFHQHEGITYLETKETESEEPQFPPISKEEIELEVDGFADFMYYENVKKFSEYLYLNREILIDVIKKAQIKGY